MGRNGNMKLVDTEVLKDEFCEHCEAPFYNNETIAQCRRNRHCEAMKRFDSTPAASPLQMAIAIKDHCKRRIDCAGCDFEFVCEEYFGMAPYKWSAEHFEEKL